MELGKFLHNGREQLEENVTTAWAFKSFGWAWKLRWRSLSPGRKVSLTFARQTFLPVSLVCRTRLTASWLSANRKSRDSRANFLVYRLLEMLRIDNGTNFSSRIWSPIWRDDFNFRFTCVDPGTERKLCYRERLPEQNSPPRLALASSGSRSTAACATVSSLALITQITKVWITRGSGVAHRIRPLAGRIVDLVQIRQVRRVRVGSVQHPLPLLALLERRSVLVLRLEISIHPLHQRLVLIDEVLNLVTGWRRKIREGREKNYHFNEIRRRKEILRGKMWTTIWNGNRD